MLFEHFPDVSQHLVVEHGGRRSSKGEAQVIVLGSTEILTKGAFCNRNYAVRYLPACVDNKVYNYVEVNAVVPTADKWPAGQRQLA